MIVFHKVAPKLAPMHFSRTGNSSLSCRWDESKRPEQLRSVIFAQSTQQDDAMVLFPPKGIPKDIEDVFEAAQTLHKADFKGYGTNFLEELQSY